MCNKKVINPEKILLLLQIPGNFMVSALFLRAWGCFNGYVIVREWRIFITDLTIKACTSKAFCTMHHDFPWLIYLFKFIFIFFFILLPSFMLYLRFYTEIGRILFVPQIVWRKVFIIIIIINIYTYIRNIFFGGDIPHTAHFEIYYYYYCCCCCCC